MGVVSREANSMGERMEDDGAEGSGEKPGQQGGGLGQGWCPDEGSVRGELQ